MEAKIEKPKPFLTSSDVKRLERVFEIVERTSNEFIKAVDAKHSHGYLPEGYSYKREALQRIFLGLAERFAKINGFDRFDDRSFILWRGNEGFSLDFLRTLNKGFQGIDLEKERETIKEFPNQLHGEIFVNSLKSFVCIDVLSRVFEMPHPQLPVFELSCILKNGVDNNIQSIPYLNEQIPWRERVKESVVPYADRVIKSYPKFFRDHPGLAIQIKKLMATRTPQL